LSVAALLAVAIVGYCMAPKGWVYTSLETNYGDVSWKHDFHALMKDYSCRSCHHNARPGQTDPAACTECHKSYNEKQPEDSENKASSAMQAYHNKCIGCHKAVKKGPMHCAECHTKSETQKKIAVADLTADHGPDTSLLYHIAAKYEPIEFNHKEHTENTDGCASCHHKETPVEATAACRSCHDVKESTKSPKKTSLLDAYHGQCIACHKEEDSGPTDCLDCHTERSEDGLKAPENGPEKAILWQLSDKYEKVVFNHSDHVDYSDSCKDCHHKGSAVEATASCRTCHNTAYSTPDGKKMGLIDAYHKQCMNCHIEQESGPLGCTDCHKEKAKK